MKTPVCAKCGNPIQLHQGLVALPCPVCAPTPLRRIEVDGHIYTRTLRVLPGGPSRRWMYANNAKAFFRYGPLRRDPLLP